MLFSHFWLFQTPRLFLFTRYNFLHLAPLYSLVSIICQSTFKRAANWQCCFVVLPSSTLGLLRWPQIQEQQRCFERERERTECQRVQRGTSRLWETMWLCDSHLQGENWLFLCLDPPCYEDNTINNVILIAWILWHWLENIIKLLAMELLVRWVWVEQN